MKSLFPVFVGATLASVWWLVAGPQQQQPQSEPTRQQEQQPIKTLRVVGQARTQAEFKAWRKIEEVTSPEKKIQLGENFLEQYPESGLTSYVHKAIAFASQKTGNYENFISHAEKALQEMADDPDILPVLALLYAERGENDKALEHSQKALEILQTIDKPESISVGQWTLQREKSMASANYARGFAYLRKSDRTAGDSTAFLKRSVEHLEKAAELDPRFDAAYFWLGTAYVKVDNVEKAIENFARAAALGGTASGLARNRLKKIYEILNKDTKGIEQIIQEQREYIESSERERRKSADRTNS